MNFELISSSLRLRESGWDEFILRHPEGTVFQSPEMYDLFEATNKMQPRVIGAVDAVDSSLKGILLAVTIREMEGVGGFFSSRTVIYGGPLVKADGPGEEERIMELLLEELIRQVRNTSIFIQFRNFFSQHDNKPIFFRQRFRYRDRMNLLIDTSSKAEVISNMSHSRFRQVQKGLRLGATIIEPENTGQVKEFYTILFNLYKYKVKKPLPGWDFFVKFHEMSKLGKLGIIRLVSYRGRIIGGILSPVTPGKTIYEWYVCGLDQDYREVHPSVLATWAAIEYAIKNNIPTFDFMGVGIPEREYGVRDFKMRFGGKLVNHGRFARINNRMLYFAAETGYNLLALMKKI